MTRRKKSSALKMAARRLPLSVPQETLVTDVRSGLTPAQVVEQRLASMLRSTHLPASHLQASRMRRALS
jgi:hypothetical protein